MFPWSTVRQATIASINPVFIFAVTVLKWCCRVDVEAGQAGIPTKTPSSDDVSLARTLTHFYLYVAIDCEW